MQTNIYIFSRGDKIIYVSKDKDLLQELLMDDYFETQYDDWYRHNFMYPSFNKNTFKFDYISPNEWWQDCADDFLDSYWEITDLTDKLI